jgi:acyl transferase domain-containing protein
MGVRLLERSPVFARRFAECAKALAAYVDWNPEDVLRGVPGAPPPDRVDIVQPLLWSVMVSLAEVWLAAGVRPAAVVGHSQGELAAATVIGAVSLENAARIVVRRSAALLRHAGRGGMISVLLPEEQVRADIAPWEPELGILAVNGPGQAIVGGELAALDELVAHYAKREISTRRVEVDVVSHCAAVEVFRDELLADWAGVTPRAARIPFYSTVTGGELEPTELTGEYWYRNLRQEVRFGATVRELLNRGHRAFIEISPHPVLSTGVTQNADACDVPATVVGSLRRAQDDVRSLLGAFGEAFANGVPVHWSRVLGPGGHVDLPTYPFQRRRYWIDEPAHRERPVPAPESQEPVTPLGERLAGLSDAAAAQLVRNVVREHVAVVMGHQGMDAVRPRLKFKELGFDSSMIVSLRNRLAAATGLALPVDALYAHPSPAELAEHVARQVREQTAAARPEPVPVPVPAPPPAADDLARAVESASVQELFALIDGFENRGIDA